MMTMSEEISFVRIYIQRGKTETKYLKYSMHFKFNCLIEKNDIKKDVDDDDNDDLMTNRVDDNFARFMRFPSARKNNITKLLIVFSSYIFLTLVLPPPTVRL